MIGRALRSVIPDKQPKAVEALRARIQVPVNTIDRVLREEFSELKEGGARLIGYAELFGFRYPVKKYREQVSPTLTRGSRLEAGEHEALKAQGFKAVVDLCAEKTLDRTHAPAAGLNYLNVPIIDNTHPTVEQMKQFLDFVSAPANQPAYVHCEAGRGRTGIAVACYQMAILKQPLSTVLRDAQAHGLELPNQIAFLKQFDAQLTAGKIAGYAR
jgi:protein-tyrosine phosphatase